MSEVVSTIANSPLLWAVTATALALLFVFAGFMIKKSIEVSRELGVPKERVNIAIKTSALASIGPSLVIMVSMISLIIVMGAPTALMRLSVVGDIGYELMANGIASDAFGVPAGVESLTPEIFQTTLFMMAFGVIGYLFMSLVLSGKSVGVVMSKMNGAGGAMASAIATAAILGCYAYVDVPYLMNMDASSVAMIVGFTVMLLLQIAQKKTGKKWLLEWGLLISMFVGMLAGALI